jgi:signal transduction histidine kinase
MTIPAPLVIPEQEAKTVELDAADLVRHLAHEIRQPLSTLDSLAYYLAIILPPTDVRAQDQVEKIRRLVAQAGTIVDDAVHYVQASPAHPVNVSLNQLVTRTLAESSRERWNVHLDLSAEPCIAHLDLVQSQHMAQHLLDLFRHLVRRDAPFSIATERRMERVQLRLSGTSETVTVERLQARFQPFDNAAPSGEGLSLASVRRIVEEHGGDLEIYSGPDDRIVVSVSFPAAC